MVSIPTTVVKEVVEVEVENEVVVVKEIKKVENPYLPKIKKRIEVDWREEDISRASDLAKCGNFKCLSQLFEMNYDPVRTSTDGLTLAMIAARQGHLPVLNLLLENNIDFSVRDNESRTVMHYAAMCAKEDVIAYHLTHAKTKICKYCL